MITFKSSEYLTGTGWEIEVYQENGGGGTFYELQQHSDNYYYLVEGRAGDPPGRKVVHQFRQYLGSDQALANAFTFLRKQAG